MDTLARLAIGAGAALVGAVIAYGIHRRFRAELERERVQRARRGAGEVA